MNNDHTSKDWLGGFSNQSLHLILFMTEQCNFRCVYCYEDFKLGNIQEEVINGVKNLVLNRISNLKNLAISFFGGEPLMNSKAVLEISNWAQHLTNQYGVEYKANITTNGYSLHQKLFRKLIAAKVSEFQITLDGDREWHDRTRVSIKQKPTFEIIHRNLLAMSRSDLEFKCLLRLNVADNNLEGVRQFLQRNATVLGKDSRFPLHFHPIWGMESLKLSRLTEMESLKALAHSLGYAGCEPSENSEKGRDKEYVCYAARADSFSIRADGRVQKCTVALNNPLNTIGQICEDGSLKLDQDKFRTWVFAERKDCPLKYLELENLAVAYEGAGKFND